MEEQLLRSKVEDALQEIRPFLQSDGGDISKGQQPTVAALPPPSGGVGSAPNSGNMPLNLNNKAAVQQQLQKMKDANSKYKNLLKMAKERIEKQEQELRTLRGMCLCLFVCSIRLYTRARNSYPQKCSSSYYH